MKHGAKKVRKQRDIVQMKVMDRDELVLGALRQKNRTLNDSDILRLALDTLAEKQGVLPDLASVS